MNKLKKRILVTSAILIVGLNIALLIWNQSLKASSIPYLANTPVDRVTIDKKGKVWVSGDGKLSVYQDGVLIQVFTKKDTPALDYRAWLLETDNQGRVWVATWNTNSKKDELAVFDGTKLLAPPPIP